MPSQTTDWLLFALLLAVVGGSVSVAYGYDGRAFGTVLLAAGSLVGTAAHVSANVTLTVDPGPAERAIGTDDGPDSGADGGGTDGGEVDRPGD